jgi:mRNA interferase RelE/StbE
MSYEVFILRRPQKALAEVPLRDYKRLKDSIAALEVDPRPHGCLKLSGRPGWRIRIRDYRVIYEVDDRNQTITVLDIGNRKDIYN